MVVTVSRAVYAPFWFGINPDLPLWSLSSSILITKPQLSNLITIFNFIFPIRLDACLTTHSPFGWYKNSSWLRNTSLSSYTNFEAGYKDLFYYYFGYYFYTLLSSGLFHFSFLNIEHRTPINDFWFIYDWENIYNFWFFCEVSILFTKIEINSLFSFFALIIFSSVLYNLLRWIIFRQT